MLRKMGVSISDPPTFEEQSPVVEILETGIKVIDLLSTICKRW